MNKFGFIIKTQSLNIEKVNILIRLFFKISSGCFRVFVPHKNIKSFFKEKKLFVLIMGPNNEFLGKKILILL